MPEYVCIPSEEVIDAYMHPDSAYDLIKKLARIILHPEDNNEN